MNNLKFSEIQPFNIVVRMPNWLGDLVMATPILADLRRRFPSAKITAMCQGMLGNIIQNDPHIDEVFNFVKPKNLFDFQAQINIIKVLKQKNYDLGLVLTNSFSSAWWFWSGGVKNSIGFTGRFRHFLLDYPVDFPRQRKQQHLVKTYKALLEPLNIPLSSTAPQLYITDSEHLEAVNLLAQHGISQNDVVIGINPGAAFGSAKCWPGGHFKDLTKLLVEQKKVKIVFFGDKAGTPLVEDICSSFSENVVNLAAKTTLRQLMALIQCCDLFLTNDSGPMHVASALEIPLIALFGSTSDVATSPYNGGKVIHKHVACSPCYRRECPLIHFSCMNQISVNEVFSEIEKIMSNNQLINFR